MQKDPHHGPANGAVCTLHRCCRGDGQFRGIEGAQQYDTARMAVIDRFRALGIPAVDGIQFYEQWRHRLTTDQKHFNGDYDIQGGTHHAYLLELYEIAHLARLPWTRDTAAGRLPHHDADAILRNIMYKGTTSDKWDHAPCL
jgi:hypothetical protein